MCFTGRNSLYFNKIPKNLFCLFLCVTWLSLYGIIIPYSKPSFFSYRNFKNYDDYLSFIEAFNRKHNNYLRLENELKKISKLWGNYTLSELFRFENLSNQLADFSLRYKIGDSNIKILNILINTFKKDLEIFLILFGTCSRFYKMKVLAPKFFDLFYEFFEGSFCFDYLKDMCDFINYEQERQKVYLKLQLEKLQAILSVTKYSLDHFNKTEVKPEIFFLLKDVYDKLAPLADTYTKIHSRKQWDERIIYSALRCVVINYSDVVKLIAFRLELERYIIYRFDDNKF